MHTSPSLLPEGCMHTRSTRRYPPGIGERGAPPCVKSASETARLETSGLGGGGTGQGRTARVERRSFRTPPLRQRAPPRLSASRSAAAALARDSAARTSASRTSSGLRRFRIDAATTTCYTGWFVGCDGCYAPSGRSTLWPRRQCDLAVSGPGHTVSIFTQVVSLIFCCMVIIVVACVGGGITLCCISAQKNQQQPNPSATHEGTVVVEPPQPVVGTIVEQQPVVGTIVEPYANKA
mmetsp:Transcript_23905/g.71866  ORF Transcript_23905/g.71866 Transcript_23905/m.71866 type:complete len:236 (+) Transcript_23905:628-1335(+)